jgi:hypothetical protein
MSDSVKDASWGTWDTGAGETLNVWWCFFWLPLALVVALVLVVVLEGIVPWVTGRRADGLKEMEPRGPK